MDHSYDSSTVVMDHTDFADLSNQLANNKGQKTGEGDIRENSAEEKESKKVANPSKKYVFRKGDQSLELDDDYEVEFMADKKATKFTLRELKERAAGDVAVKNRMHSLAEEKKQIQSTFKKFAEISRQDPLAALEYIANKAKESDSEFEYDTYIEKLAEQADKMGQMTQEERRAMELEKKLAKAEEDLSHNARKEAVVLRKQELMSDYPEIGDSEFREMVDVVLSTDELLEGLETEQDVMNKVEELIQETLTQRDIMSVIRDINPSHVNDNELIFSLSDQLKQNPDLDEEDVRDIVRELIAREKELNNVQPSKRIGSATFKRFPIRHDRQHLSNLYERRTALHMTSYLNN